MNKIKTIKDNAIEHGYKAAKSGKSLQHAINTIRGDIEPTGTRVGFDAATKLVIKGWNKGSKNAS